MKRADATVVLDGKYEETSKLVISYPGMESDEAVQHRIARCLDYVREKLEGERRTFERLKQKFGAR